jgi:hypothetical protein
MSKMSKFKETEYRLRVAKGRDGEMENDWVSFGDEKMFWS